MHDLTLESPAHTRRIRRLAFPYYDCFPSRLLERRDVSPVSLHIVLKFLQPEIDSGFRRVGKTAPGVTVPETPMDEHDCFPLRQHDVGPAWQIPAVKTEAEAQSVKRGADQKFRCGISAPDPAHVPAAAGCAETVGHQLSP